jgi:predicted lipid-binding transport protein (Tim44 family)
MGPLAGLAAGIGLAALASHFGFGEELASMMMMALIAVAVIAVIGFFLRRAPLPTSRPWPVPAPVACSTPPTRVLTTRRRQLPPRPTVAPPLRGSGGCGCATTAAVGNIPADFDAEAFVRNAKVNFIRLQAANDARNLEDIREYTTPEMFAEIKMNWMDDGSAQKTDVVSLNAEVST